MKHFEKQLDSQIIFEGRVVRLRRDQVELEDGSRTMREVIAHPGGVGIVALDDNDCLLMVRQYRYPFGEQLLEIPAGKLEYGEDPAACGRRELEEETGYVAAEYSPLGKLYPTPAYDDEVIHLFFARGLRETEQRLDAGEFLTVERVPFAQAVRLVQQGEICDAKTQIGVLRACLLRQRGEL